MEWQNFLEPLSRKLRITHLNTPNEIKAKMKRENELMSYLLADQEVREFISLWLEEKYKNRESKSIEKAKIFKDIGNKDFQAKNYTSSIQSYTKVALYAPADSEVLPLAIANRSAALYHLGKYEDCIKNIELAIKLEYPEKLRHKLYLRAVQSYLKLGKPTKAKEALVRVREIMTKCTDIPDVKKEDIEKQIAHLASLASCMHNDTEDTEDNDVTQSIPELAFGENPDFPSASAAVDKKYSSEKGRYVVANRDIRKGQILFVEKPFAFVLVDYGRISGSCENCCRPYGDVPVPCTMCLDTLYCNMKCWNDDYTFYHRWECPGSQMGLWQQNGIARLALKVFLMCSTTSDRNRFNEVQKLITNFDKLSLKDLIAYGITATMLTLYLLKYSDFFEDNDLTECLISKFSDETYNFPCETSVESDRHLYVGSLLLRHILQLVSNGHAITKLDVIVSDKDKVLTERENRVAKAIYPSASMMNHSCDPNVINSFMDQYLIVKAIKDIGAGEEVYTCYGAHFRQIPRDYRQLALKSQYCFTCKCEPCTIPELQYFMERFNAIKCPECSGALYTVHNYFMHCLDCGATPTLNYDIELKQAQDLFEDAQVYIEMEREEEALDKLKQCLSIRRSVLYKYHEDITATLDLIGKVYAIMGRWLDSISYLEHSIAAVSERFGSCSIELANELNKLTDICIRYLQEEPNTATKWYKNILKKTRRYLSHAEEILNFNYGPWNNACGEISEKQKILSVLLKDFNI
ncbi:SET and MYND domain-containing protein 4-like [Vespula pensylvanica]|uniref:Protein-lysine N-methyltransferase SMYD4 n=1 Tax=Vespula pensylvanica TaxID=30213 RepID=A0A834JV74_VESPE|nr:SET and MYND domain-containing protein 4-like [Vespula pensylvanica]XP_043683946.1 SET and MYND domain-containing protein 4-like [Vespula pensylvanica]XP_043683947.1 SET and MYND domain-containing protein 4-like [Vespula pensylvanica]KAF7392161.1 hypothetical protein H0235_017160 [Vespula pensylvanica]